jgi:hypothetical protein
MWWNRPKAEEKQYLIAGRLADVLALLQVLALDPHTHRSEEGLCSDLQGAPRSANAWTAIAELHPEFFRVKKEKSISPVSLVARHVLPKDDQGVRQLPSEFVGQLIEAAVNLHDRQVRRDERWTYLVPIWVALITVVGGIIAIIIRAALDGTAHLLGAD